MRHTPSWENQSLNTFEAYEKLTKKVNDTILPHYKELTEYMKNPDNFFIKIQLPFQIGINYKIILQPQWTRSFFWVLLDNLGTETKSYTLTSEDETKIYIDSFEETSETIISVDLVNNNKLWTNISALIGLLVKNDEFKYNLDNFEFSIERKNPTTIELLNNLSEQQEIVTQSNEQEIVKIFQSYFQIKDNLLGLVFDQMVEVKFNKSNIPDIIHHLLPYKDKDINEFMIKAFEYLDQNKNL